MARNRIPLDKALVSGSAAKNPQRFRDRKILSITPLGEPYPKMTEAQKLIWHELAYECDWLKGSHRPLLRLTCMMLARMDSDKQVGASATRVASALLSKLGATPIDASRVKYNHEDEPQDSSDRFFN